ncbi:MAG: P-loop NTPase [bacterium]|nr:P-loop NTPase [bacterium]
MQIAVASGKGGTGKTTISVALAAYIAQLGIPVTILDCDVEEPNTNLFLKNKIENQEAVYSLIPAVDMDTCSGCGKCGEICAFSAIVMINNKPLVFSDMCHSCGGCALICTEGAITETKKKIGIVEQGMERNINYIGGRLNISEVMSPPLIKAVKNKSDKTGITIIDSPPGTSCPVIESISTVDYVILVTEPTPFGLHDLKLAVGMVHETGIPFSVLINRSGIGDSRVEDYCTEEGIDVIATIPDSRDVAEKYSKGEFAQYFIKEFSYDLSKILDLYFLHNMKQKDQGNG